LRADIPLPVFALTARLLCFGFTYQVVEALSIAYGLE
jgi:hypothetical protein